MNTFHFLSQQTLFSELIESTMYLYRATNDSMLLDFGKAAIHSIESTSKTDCGYATVLRKLLCVLSRNSFLPKRTN